MSKSCLIDEKVIIKLVVENSNPSLDKTKDGFLKLEGTHFVCDAPRSTQGIRQVLSNEERNELEKVIDQTRKPGWLLESKLDNNVWSGKKRYKLTLTEESTVLFLKKPIDFIKFAIARANVDLIAPSYEKRLDRNYVYYMEFESNAINHRLSSHDKKMKAYGIVHIIKDNRSKMLDLLMLLFRGDHGRIPTAMSTELARERIYGFIDNNIDEFLFTASSDQYEMMLEFYCAVASGALSKSESGYSLSYSNYEIIGKSEVEAITWIKELKEDKTKSDTYQVLRQRIKSYKETR